MLRVHLKIELLWTHYRTSMDMFRKTNLIMISLKFGQKQMHQNVQLIHLFINSGPALLPLLLISEKHIRGKDQKPHKATRRTKQFCILGRCGWSVLESNMAAKLYRPSFALFLSILSHFLLFISCLPIHHKTFQCAYENISPCPGQGAQLLGAWFHKLKGVKAHEFDPRSRHKLRLWVCCPVGMSKFLSHIELPLSLSLSNQYT